MSEEQAPSEAQKKEDVVNDLKAEYQRVVSEETDKTIEEAGKENMEDFAKVKKMGFTTATEVAGELKLVNEKVDKLNEEWDKLRKFILRSKAKGDLPELSDKKPDEKDELKKIYGDFAE